MHACGLFSQGKKIRQARGSAPARMPLGEAVINILASGDKPFDGLDGFIEHGLLVFRQFNVHDLLNTVFANDRWYADIHIF